MINREETAAAIAQGRAILGIELGSTRIKAVLIDEENRPVAEGGHGWENRLENGIWTYTMEDIRDGLQDCYRRLKEDVAEKYGVRLTRLAAMGFSAMMHGYLAFDGEGRLLVPFRTWRNTMTEQAAKELSELFQFNIPQRWSSAHLYQAILNGEPHVQDVRFLTTLAGYIHWQMTGRKVVGIGEAAGMFPIDSAAKDYDQGMIDQFDGLIADRGYPWKLRGDPAAGPGGRRGRRHPDGGGGEAPGSGRRFKGRDPALPAGGRCRDRDGGHQQREGVHRKCFRRNQCVCHGSPGKTAFHVL